MSSTSAPLRPSRNRPVQLSGLFPSAPDLSVSGVSIDSRSVLPGDLYVGLPGAQTHGARFAATAAEAGAVALLTDAAGAEWAAGSALPVVVVADPRAELARVAAEVYGRPGDRLALFGVTGTTGKTSTSFLLAAGLAAAGHQVGTIGTIGFRLGEQQLASGRTTVTTPESSDLQALLAYLVERGADAVAMEVSSHALALHRVDQLRFGVAGFTNLGRDHLDFHLDQESYFQAKAELFRNGRAAAAVVCIDDEYGRRLADEIRAGGQMPLLTTGADDRADYYVASSELQPDGSRLVRLATPTGQVGFRLGLLGEFNLRNATTAAAMLDVAGLDLSVALSAFGEAAVPGRMQRVDLGPGAPGVIVDFAHTPESVTAALNGIPQGRRIAVLGCGGDRDQAKRGPMGVAAATGAQVVIVTDDNPRSEDPAAIRAAVLAGARAAAAESGAEVIDGGDRTHAIRTALRLAGSDDWIAILGKGHESGQQLAHETIAFDDVAVVGREWRAVMGEPDA
ncbi:UDP-N-acetylmuramoylalanyl-D-glutamate--2,6-diaminopimelate ligase [Propionicimonas paludicola]|uniref:UDP-N-acetylmuramoyl-L-alanyl-D-glutamate--2,6-diaminopimelate ligase n=1 Tax=Propionicimonas paludicola TaxID=185243 RepID=A0A2A9CRB6_9ACTN|nr:UDP-N-acetylmuramoyl-L-alanyl-D-glutamate--2,6-diaminopimelate ligase [Propionicimonas paludicola]PFG16974.1 UDP-N-acetylmuramoylalanyl-D-glutamate--2,6-diaminopimelate ligase [Propionicimonas paludicola]